MPDTRRIAAPLVSAFVVAAVALLGGCAGTRAGSPSTPTVASHSSQAATPPSPPSRSTSTPSEPVSATVDTLSREPGPDLLHDHSPAGAENYVEDYLNRLDAAWTKPQPSLLDNRAAKACGTCTNFRNAAAELSREGRRHAHPMLVVSDVSLVVWQHGVRVTADARQTDHKILDKNGNKVRDVKGSRVFLYVDLSYRGRWWIESIGIDPVNDDGTHRDR